MENSEGVIIYNVEPLEEAFIPTRLFHRDGQRDEIIFYLRPALKGKPIRNLYIFGPPGTGKTVLIKYILDNYFPEISAYVNCFRFRTTKEILKEILFKFGIYSRKTESNSDLFKKVEELNKNHRLIICLDEADQIKNSDKDEVLYNLAEIGCGLILISNKLMTHLLTLDPRTRDRLNLHDIEFPAYRPDELFDIGKDRIKFSFVPGTISDRLIMTAARLSEGDARVLLLALKNAGRYAEEEGKSKVELKHILKGVLEAKRLRKSKLLEKLNDHERVVYSILEEHKRLPAGELYKLYTKKVKNPVGKRAFRYYMKHMATLGLVKSIGVKRWRVYEIVI